MRRLTIKREKSFVGCTAKMQVYIEDTYSAELQLPVASPKNDDEQIDYIGCRKIGELKNGEEASFEIGEEAIRVFVIADKVSKDWCNDCYQLPDGSEDISLSGRNRLNPAAGNAFRFNGNDGTAAAVVRKKSTKRGVIILIASILLGFLLGYGITAAIFGFINSKEKAFTAGEMSITLNEGFEQQRVAGYSAIYSSKDVIVFVNRDNIKDVALKNATDYATSIIAYNGFDTELITDGNLNHFIVELTESDGTEYCYYAYTYKSDEAFWLIQFAVEKNKAAKYADDIADWAKSVSFN